MKKTRRWLALLLAVILVGSNALYQIGTSMSASETDTTAESGQQDDSAAVPETQDQDTAALNQQNNTGGVQVQEVTPQTQQKETTSQSEAAKTQQVQPAQNNTSASDQNTQAAPSAEPVQETPEEKTYHVTIQKSDVDGGTIKAWGSDGNKTDVTYNSENKYVKEVKEGENFNFEITAKDAYKVAKVTDQNGTTVEPKAVNNNVYTYEVKNITAERTYSITYAKEEVKKAESTSNGDQQKSDDEQSEDADDDGEPAAKAAAEEVMTDFYVGADRTSVTVGDTVNVKAIIKPDNYSNKKVTWESSDDDTATVDENGVVTTLQTGIVTITGTSEANAEYTDSVVIQINPVSVTGITINGYNKDYLTKNESVQLTAVAEPQNAEDKELTWSSSNKNVATVDQTGNVTAKGQGTAVIRVENTASGKYATQEVTVYEKKPQSVTVHVWVTNQDEGKTYIFYLPEDGTVVNASSVHKSVEGYVTTGDIRVGSWISAGSSWTNIKKVTTAKRFRYNNGNIQYSTSDSGNNWKNVGAKSIVDFCESVRKGDSSSDTDVKVILGDWPYNDGVNPAHNRQTIRIEVVAKDDADNTTVVYNSGTMRYDNASNGEYGKIKFNCDESRYEVEKVLVYKNDAGTGNVYKTYKEIPTGGINVSFTTNATNHYLVRAIVKPKKFNVVYDANGGENAPDPETLTAVNGQKVTVATTPQPTRTDYIFAGWEYNGTTYYGGESFEMPPSNVTFVAKWIPASTAISYKSNNTDWGTVSRSHEIVKDGATAKGSVANAKEGYEFVEWQDADGKQVSTNNFYQPEEKAGSYTAIFEAKTYDVRYQFTGEVPDGATLPETQKYKFDSKVKVAEVTDVPGYTFEGWTSQDVTLKDGTFTMPAKNVTLTGTWKQKAGKFGYYLSLAAATWEGGTPANLEENGKSEQGLPKYAEKVHYSYGDKYNVISNVPTAEGYAFIGWLDKERGDQKAAIRSVGDELTYIYKAGDKNQAYTLDALWASIAAKGGTYTYTGSSHQIKADIAINEGLNLNEEYVKQAKQFITTGEMNYSTDNKTWSEKNPSFTDAGTYTVYVKQDVTVGGTTTTLQSSAQIVINPRNVELTSATASKMYDGKALTKKEVTVSGDGFITGEGATYNVTGSQKVVGSSENTFTYTLTKATKEKNYNITTKNGTLTVTNRDAKYEITVKANSTTGTYNGTEYSAIGLESTTFTVDGNVYTVSGLTTEDPVKKDAGTYTNNVTGTAVVKDADGNDVTNQFLVKTVNGSLVINKAAVTLKSADLSKEYDGEALVNGTTALETETGWAEGEGADYAFTGSQTLAGSSSNTFSYALRANTNINNYTISKTEGTLTVTNRSAKYEITVKANSTTTTYNGKTHSAKGVESNEFTINGKKYTVSGLTTGDPEQKNAGTYPNNITGTAIVKDAKGNDVTKQFAVKIENGSLVINKATVTLKSADLSKEYDGKALVNGKTALETETGWAEGEGADYTFTGSQTLVGNSSNTFSYALKANTNSDNYTINKTEGTLSVTNRKAKYTVTVTANSTTATYNGTEYSATGMKTTTFTVNGEEYTVSGLKTEDPKQRDAGTYTNNITGTAIVTDKDGNNVTSEFAVNTENGSLKIKKAEVTLKSANLNKVYDGEALVNGNVALATETGWAESDKAGVVYEFTGSQTEVGSSENKFAVKWNDTVKESNYNVSIEFGTLTVTEQSIVPGPDPENPVPNYKGIKIDDPSDVPYDGNEHKWTPVVTDKDGNELTEGTDYEVSYNKKDYTNVTGAIEVTITGKGNYTGSVIKSYQITPASVSIKTNGAERVYNGKPLTADGTIEGLLNNETVDFKVTGSQTEVGNSKNTYTLKWTGTAKESNYQIVSEEIGTLVVTENAEELVVTTTGGTFTYTGLAHGATVTVSELPEGYTLETAESSATATDVTDASGVAATADKLVIRNAAGEDVTAKLNIKKVDGTIVVTPAALTITTPDANKVYDGNALTAAGTISGFVNGETATFATTGSQTEVGNSENTYTLTWDGTAKETNYTVSDSVGTLKVTEQSIIPGPDPENPVPNYKGIKIDDPSDVPYDGNEHKWTPVVTDKDGNELTEGTDYEVSYNKKDYTNVTGAIEVTITGKGNYTGSVIKSYQITPASVSIKTNGAERVYNGKPLTADGTIEGLLNNETVDFKVTGSQTEVGNSKNTYTLKWTGTAKESNYQIVSEEIGTLVVTENAEELVVTTTGGTFTYTGLAHGATVTVSELPEGYTLETAESSATATDVTKLPVKATADKLVIKNAQGKDVTDKLKIKKIDGTIKVTPAALTITTPKAEKVYDGNALTADGTISGFVNGETATFVTTGSQTEVGNSKNTYTLTWDGTAKEANYTVSDSVGTLKVTKQSIVPDPDNPESYKDVTIDDPSDATYDGKEHKWTPVVTDKDGNELKEGTDYEVSYSKDDFTNVTGEIKVTITGKGNYTGTVDKTYQITPKAVIITTDSDTRAFNDQPLTAPGRVDGIVAGETYGFTVTGTQTYVGSSANSYQMTWAKKGENKYTAKKSNYKVEENIGTLTVTDGTPENPVTPSLVVNKTHDTDKTYKAGDVITFTITVKNIYDEAKTITLEEQEGVTLDKTTFENVKPGKEITATATYTVTEADIVNGTFTNNVKATFSGVDKEYTGTDTVDKFEESRPHMTITKVTKDAGKDHIYKLGETINYVITVKNDGNLTLTNVKIEDALTGNAGENAWTIDTFAPGETQTFETSYVVTEADVIAGKVVNNATGEAENPDPKKEETPVTPGEKEDPVETPNPGLTVIKTSDKTGEVKLGDKITYTITVTNNGNVTISGVKLEDSLTGDDWTLGNIKPGETVTKKTTYTVTEKDIIAGKVENHATATGKEPGGKDITGEGEKTVTTEESNPQITVTKETTSTPKNGKTYALGEKITYKITAKNTGNLTLTDVTVSDKLTGNTGDKAFKIDGKFKPGEEATFEASYTVKESDLGKTVVNEATAAGKTTDPKNPEPGVTPGTTEDPVDQKNPAMTITKKVTDKKEEYQIGDTVEYEITVKNTGNTTQNNVLVEDRMNAAGSAVITKVEGAKGTIDGANVTLDTLAPGKEATIKAEYTVVKEDRGNTITNAAVAKGEGETPVTPEVPVDVEDVYDIHVTHVFADGEESSAALPEDYDIENLKPGTTKLLNAEEVSGYTAYPAAERVTIEEEDVTVTFVYYKDAIGTDPANPDQPDNIPDRYQAVVKFEAVNGTVNIDHAVVTLFDENNEPAENGVGHLSLLQIANATADAGYDQSSLSWTPANPTIRYEITGEMTFTASFTATLATPGTTPANPTNPTPATPSTPANPAPSTPSTPANQTPARSTNIITRAAEAIADGAERIASDVREVLNNDDEDVPLAKQKLDDHKCCILHFLIMLLAAILYGFYTHNMKKRQKKMFEAREELDLELARRGLPTTKEQEQM